MRFAEARDEAGLWKRLERYGRRFPSSLYGESFWLGILAELITWSRKGPPPQFARLDSVISGLPVAQRRRLYIALARGAAMASLPALTEFAGRRIERIAVAGSHEQQLGNFYVSLFAVVGTDGGDALMQLQSLDRRSFTPTEQALLDAALAVGRHIQQPPSSKYAGSAVATTEQSPLVERGTSLLKDTGQVLENVE